MRPHGKLLRNVSIALLAPSHVLVCAITKPACTCRVSRVCHALSERGGGGGEGGGGCGGCCVVEELSLVVARQSTIIHDNEKIQRMCLLSDRIRLVCVWGSILPHWDYRKSRMESA